MSELLRGILVGETTDDTVINCLIVFGTLGMALTTLGMFLWDVLNVPARVWDLRVLVARRGCKEPSCVMCQLRSDVRRAERVFDAEIV